MSLRALNKLLLLSVAGCTAAEEPSLRFIDVPTEVQAAPDTNPDLEVTLEATGFDAPVQYRLDNFTSDTVVVGEIIDRATTTIGLFGCAFGAEKQGNFLMASIVSDGDVDDRADVVVVCVP